MTGQSLVGANGSGEVTFRTYTPVPGLKLTPNPDRGGKPKHSQHFQTEPSLLPPSIKVLKKKGPVNKEGDLFTAPKIAVGQDGAMITDPKGRLIWFHRAPKGTSIYDFRTQNLNGQPVLTWWEGRVLFAKGYGQGVIYDNTYKKVAKIKGGNGFKPDLHEFQLGSNGSAYTLSFQPVMYDLSSVGGPKSAAVFDSVVQQIDIKTGLVESEWHALGHIPFTDSYVHYVRGSESPYDPFHVNSVEPESNENWSDYVNRSLNFALETIEKDHQAFLKSSESSRGKLHFCITPLTQREWVLRSNTAQKGRDLGAV